MIWLLFAQPGLSSTEQGDTHKPADLELGTLVAQFHLAAVDIAVLGIEDLPAVIAITLFLKSPHDSHPHDRLVVTLTFAFGAQWIALPLIGPEEDLLNLTLKRTVDLHNTY